MLSLNSLNAQKFSVKMDLPNDFYIELWKADSLFTFWYNILYSLLDITDIRTSSTLSSSTDVKVPIFSNDQASWIAKWEYGISERNINATFQLKCIFVRLYQIVCISCHYLRLMLDTIYLNNLPNILHSNEVHCWITFIINRHHHEKTWDKHPFTFWGWFPFGGSSKGHEEVTW